ncbi:MAG: type II toxin-antitoxin system VapC family toxin [Acidobacteriota bacterium]
MVIDTSALLAIFQNEPEQEAFNRLIAAAPVRLLSAANVVETSIVIGSRFGDQGIEELDRFLDEAAILVVAVTPRQAQAARNAYFRYGKSHHRAGLNYGDCFAYALAKTMGQTLLFKGNDFSQTDIAPAYEARDVS